MRKYIYFLVVCFSFFSSELIAQTLSLKINGATTNETEIINSLNYNRNHIDYNSIINEVDSLQKKIIKSGYIESQHSSIRKTNDSSFQIKFQLKNKYKEIEIYYKQSEIKKSDIDLISDNSFKDHFIVPYYKVENTLQFLSNKITRNGFPFSKLKLSAITVKNKTTLQANLIIIKDDNKRRLDKIVIKGYEKFPKSYLKHYLKIKPEKTFDIVEIKKKITLLNNLRFAEQIKEPEVLFTKDSTLLYIYVQKSKSNTFDGFLGFSTNEETNKLDFNGYLNLELNNNLNYGESFKVLYKSNESEEKNFEANLNSPYLFKSPIGIELELNIFKKDSSFTTVNQKANVFYQLNSKNKVFLGIENTESNNLLENSSRFLINNYKSKLYNSKYVFENRKNYNRLFQINTYLELEFGFGSRTQNSNEEKQQKLIFDAAHIFNLNKKNSVFLRFSGALLNSENYLENELFRFGGINSIRGFKENSITASRYGFINTEYRYQLSNSIYTHTIIDFANFENKISNTKENLYGFGLGFGIITKAGLLKFNFANGKTETQTFKFSNSKIHLSLVSIF